MHIVYIKPGMCRSVYERCFLPFLLYLSLIIKEIAQGALLTGAEQCTQTTERTESCAGGKYIVSIYGSVKHRCALATVFPALNS